MIEFTWLFKAGCNYSCPYCPYRGIEAGKSFKHYGFDSSDQVSVKRWISAWRAVRDKFGQASIFITSSGEPLLDRSFLEIAPIISEWHVINFDTNLSLPMSELDRFLGRIRPERVEFSTTYHPTEADFEEFVGRVSRLKDGGCRYSCRMVAYPVFLDRLEKDLERFRERQISVHVIPFAGMYEGRHYPQGYTQNQKRLILKINHNELFEQDRSTWNIVKHISELQRESPKGNACRSGAQYAFVAANGTVYRCQTYGFRGMGAMGRLWDEDFSMRTENAACQFDLCGCEYRWLAATK